MANAMEKRIEAAERAKREADERLKALLKEDRERKAIEKKRKAERDKIAREKLYRSLGEQVPAVVDLLKQWPLEAKDSAGNVSKAPVYDVLCRALPKFAQDMAALDALNNGGSPSSPTTDTPGASPATSKVEGKPSQDTQARSNALKGGE